MLFNRFEIGKKFPLEHILEHFKGIQDGGASLSYNDEDKTLSLYVALATPTKREINAFKKGLLRFALYHNDILDTAILLTDYDTEFTIDLIYDINVYDLNVDGLVEGNALHMFLIDSKSGALCGMRMIGLGSEFMKQINRITRNDKRYTSAEYNEWLRNDVYKKSLEQLWREAERVDWNK